MVNFFRSYNKISSFENDFHTFCTKKECNVIQENVNDYKLKLYPNPANNVIVMEWDGMDRTEFELFDVTGRRLMEMHAYGGRKYLDVSNLEAGVYFIRINQAAVKKLVISR